MKVYLVEQGSYGESWPVCVFSERAAAVAFVESEIVRLTNERVSDERDWNGPPIWDTPEDVDSSLGYMYTSWGCNYGDHFSLSGWEVQ